VTGFSRDNRGKGARARTLFASAPSPPVASGHDEKKHTIAPRGRDERFYPGKYLTVTVVDVRS